MLVGSACAGPIKTRLIALIGPPKGDPTKAMFHLEIIQVSEKTAYFLN